MDKSVVASAVAALAFFGVQHQREVPVGPTLQLKEERMVIEYSATLGEAVLVAEAESEDGVRELEIRDPSGASILRLSSDRNAGLGMYQFAVELTEAAAATVLDNYPAGVYSLRGRTVSGHVIVGEALLSHELLAAPAVIYPFEGAVDVSPTSLVVSWVPDPEATGYSVLLEQGENDGLTVELPAGTTSFAVPPGVLRSGLRSHVEVGVVAPNGNRTLTEVQFSTR